MLRDQRVSIPAGQRIQLFVNADYLRIKAANIPFRFETKNGDDFEIKQGDEVSIQNFEYVYITNQSASDEVLDLYTAKDERVNSAELSGSVNVSGAVELGAATLAALETVDLGATTLNALESVEHSGQTYGASFASTAVLVGNTPQTVFTPASNVNGAIIHSAQFYSEHAAGGRLTSLLAKTSAPANVADGDALLTPDYGYVASVNGCSASLKNPIKVPAGKGLYFIATTTENTGIRSVLYTLL